MHGGRIETDHNVVFSLAPGLGGHFSLPESSATEPGAMSNIIDNDIHPIDGKQRAELQTSLPTANDPFQRSRESKFLASTDKLVKWRFDVSADRGHPAYNPAGTEPSIALRGADEELFGAPFVI